VNTAQELIDLSSLAAQPYFRGILDARGKTLWLPHFPVEEPADFPFRNTILVERKLRCDVVPWPAQTSLGSWVNGSLLFRSNAFVCSIHFANTVLLTVWNVVPTQNFWLGRPQLYLIESGEVHIISSLDYPKEPGLYSC
jgi:hypothetical protein